MKTMIAGLIAASMNPLGMLIAKARGTWDSGSLSNAFVMHYPDYLLVGVAVVISRVVTKLGQQVTRAREYHCDREKAGGVAASLVGKRRSLRTIAQP